MDDSNNPEEAPDFDTPVPVDKDGNPDPKGHEKWKPRRGSDPAAPKLIAARVQRIAMIMAAGEWEGWSSAFALAMEWGLKVPTVQVYAGEAGRLLDRNVEDDEELRAIMRRTLRTIMVRATREKKYRDAIESVRVLAGLTGLDKAYEAGKANTAAIVGLTDVIGAAARAAVAANAAGDEPDGNTGDDGGGG